MLFGDRDTFGLICEQFRNDFVICTAIIGCDGDSKPQTGARSPVPALANLDEASWRFPNMLGVWCARG